MSSSAKIAVLGAGAWGTALGCAMVRAGHEVLIWGRNESVVSEINAGRNPAYLNNISLEKDLTATDSLQKAVSGARVILLVIPAQSISKMVGDLSAIIDNNQIIIACAKGIEQKSGKTPAQLISCLVNSENIGVLSGPSFASDVARALPTALTLAFDDMARAKKYADLLSSDNFRIYASNDVIGVELGGALKNVLALAVGAARGMELGASAEAALIARGFSELRHLAVKMGGNRETLSGLSGLGDLVLTASSTQSRNFSYGVALGRGEDIAGLALAEGVHTAQIAGKLARDIGVEAPIIQSVGDVLAGKLTAQNAVRQLLSRPLKAENE
ncbi:MAG: NAD(P)-dependent glycerol-3-phosphate dehydrogenase [Rhizobiaceae bacterium]|nr:NAD(P)-dependent glycerol-3-phosphate dehydrogenase [Rhizobiaceae bacterium]